MSTTVLPSAPTTGGRNIARRYMVRRSIGPRNVLRTTGTETSATVTSPAWTAPRESVARCRAWKTNAASVTKHAEMARGTWTRGATSRVRTGMTL